MLICLLSIVCGESYVVTETPTMLATPGFPENYLKMQDCSWTLSVSAELANHDILLQFTLFDVEDEYDFLYVGDGSGL